MRNTHLLEDLLIFDIKHLNKILKSKADQLITGKVYWFSNKKEVLNLSYYLKSTSTLKTLIISYSYNLKEYSYSVELAPKKSNLGNSLVWYFKCPKSKILCRKLHFIDGYFNHRSTNKKLYYALQVDSKKYRKISKDIKNLYLLESYYKEISNKYFKPYYKGQKTKRYQLLEQKINEYEKIDFKSLRNLNIR